MVTRKKILVEKNIQLKYAGYLIFSMLVALKPLLAISLVFVLGGTYILTYRLIRRRLGVKGHRRYKANAKRFRILNEGFGEIKLLKLMGYENYMIKRYSKPGEMVPQAQIGEIQTLGVQQEPVR